MEEIEDGLAINLISTVLMSFVVGVEESLPPGLPKTLALKRAYTAINDLRKLSSVPLTEGMVCIGGDLYNKFLGLVEEALDKAVPDDNQ